MVDLYHMNHSSGKKGGALLSALHSNMQHGDPFVKSLVRHTLNLVRLEYMLVVVIVKKVILIIKAAVSALFYMFRG